MTKFDFEKKWALCAVHLQNPELQQTMIGDRKLPPCVSLLKNVDDIYKQYEVLAPKWNKPIDTTTINNHWEEFVSLFDVSEEMVIDVVNLLNRTGYTSHVQTQKHSASELAKYYANHPDLIWWYCVPAGCHYWVHFMKKLAQLTCPDRKWMSYLILTRDKELHSTVTDGEMYFDLLDWYEGGILTDV